MNRYQWARADGHPDWTPGAEHFNDMWANASDGLRFHTGDGFTIREHPHDPGRVRQYAELHDRLMAALNNNKNDTVFTVRAEVDNFSLSFRKHEVTMERGELVIEHAKTRIGTPYVLGGTDCSWLSMTCYGLEGVDLPHNAHLQHLDDQILPIQRGQILPGDLLFHHDDAHVSIYLDSNGPGGNGRVIDEEPSDTGSPSGWPTSHLGVGCRVRPMNPGYYCDWANVCGIGRAVKINGNP